MLYKNFQRSNFSLAKVKFIRIVKSVIASIFQKKYIDPFPNYEKYHKAQNKTLFQRTKSMLRLDNAISTEKGDQ